MYDKKPRRNKIKSATMTRRITGVMWVWNMVDGMEYVWSDKSNKYASQSGVVLLTVSEREKMGLTRKGRERMKKERTREKVRERELERERET